MEEKATFSTYYAFLFQESENATETRKKDCAVYGDGAVTDRKCKWFAKFRAAISCWMMLHSQVDQLRLIAIK